MRHNRVLVLTAFVVGLVILGVSTAGAVARDRGSSRALSKTTPKKSSPLTVGLSRFPAKVAHLSTARFTFWAFDGAKYECSLDGHAYSRCSNPTIYSHLGDGAHFFAVKASAGRGVYGPANVYHWTIVTTATTTTTTTTTTTRPPTTSTLITEFSAGISANAGLRGIAAGTDGNLWFVESGANSIAKITPAGVVTEYRVQNMGSSTPGGLGLTAITVGLAGNLWFTENSYIGEITPAGAISQYSIFPHDDSGSIEAIALGPGGAIWVALTDGIARVGTSGTGAQLTKYFSGATGGDGITTDPAGNLWFTEPYADKIGEINAAGVVTQYSAGITSGSFPSAITAGPDGNLWFTEEFGGIGKITPTGVVTEYTAGIAPLSDPEMIVAGPDGNLWFTQGNGHIGKITTAGVVTQYSSGITAGGAFDGIAVGPDHNIWFTEGDGNRIGRVVLGER